MDFSPAVQRVERRERSQQDADRLRHFERAASQPIGERLAFQQLHHNVRLLLVFSNFIELADIGMRQARRGPRFSPKPIPGLAVVERLTDHLDRDRPVEARIVRGINDPHTALAELADNPIGTYLAECRSGIQGSSISQPFHRPLRLEPNPNSRPRSKSARPPRPRAPGPTPHASMASAPSVPEPPLRAPGRS